ncbi:uncharacterized protein LOC109704915 isoform X1 [Ananas comosus]|uniref:Uncharacterized protein LOC109704915 isoform X1 n=1 Tax=Ananas comosus TaxID=4615 RepID=A0A6P5EDF9_ANACO|nr:uncharacterized protein LOC109704915 isoform X1 [Ananas comosus]
MIHLLMQSTSCRDLTVSTSDHEAFAGFSASSVRALKISNSPLILRRPRNAHLKILRSDDGALHKSKVAAKVIGEVQALIVFPVLPYSILAIYMFWFSVALHLFSSGQILKK